MKPLDIEPGAETDRLVAEAIGWEKTSGEECVRRYFEGQDVPEDRRHTEGLWHLDGKLMACEECGDMKQFSTDLNDAFFAAEQVGLFTGDDEVNLYLLHRVVEEYVSNGPSVSEWAISKVEEIGYDEWGFTNTITAATPALVICKAILKLKDTSQ
jgi:hypothetical protein